MFIARVKSKGPQGQSYTSILLRQSIRKGAKVASKTLAVLTHLPAHLIELLEQALHAQNPPTLAALAQDPEGHFQLRCAESFGALFAVHQIAQRLGLPKALGQSFAGQLGLWQVLARVLRPGISLLAMVRLATTSAAASLLGWTESFNEDDLYAQGAWLVKQQAKIEHRLWQARPAAPPTDRPFYFYDVTSSYLEGLHNALAAYGYSRDELPHKLQVVVGLLTDELGEPCSIQVYPGNTSDPKTLADALHKARQSFACGPVVIVGDRGMIRTDQKALIENQQSQYISALTKPQIEKLLKRKVLQMEFFEEKVQEVVDGKRRLILRRNPQRQAQMQESRQERQEKLATWVAQANHYLATHAKARVEVQEQRLTQKMKQWKLAAFTQLKTAARKLTLAVDAAALQEEGRLDGCYVIETDLVVAQAGAQSVHDRYKDLKYVEEDFRTLKLGHLEMRPWYVCTEANTRAHAFTCLLALKIRRVLKAAWQPFNWTVEEGLAELEKLCVMELVDTRSHQVVARLVPQPSEQQKRMLEALALEVPQHIPEAKVKVGTRKQLKDERKPPIK